MTSKHIRPGALAGARGPGESFSSAKKSSSPRNTHKPHSGPVPKAVLLPILNDDCHVVGHSYCILSEGLRARIRRMAEEGSR